MVRTIDPLVSTDWLEAHLSEQAGGGPAGGPGPVIIDIREPHLFEAGHIPGSISIPFSPVSAWATSDDELLMELPPDDELLELLGANGLTAGTPVVLVGTVEPPPAPPYALSDAPRVAATLYYAGVRDVAILEGGYPKWAAEGRATMAGRSEPSGGTGPSSSADTGAAAAGAAAEAAAGATRAGGVGPGLLAKEMFVSTEYVKDHLGTATLIDGRDPDQFFGISSCPFAGVGGHIPGARSLPAPWMWREDGTYQPREVLEQMAAGVAGPDKDQEIILYCGVGGYAAAWWFVLSQVLGYKNVKIYDGAAEAWVKSDPMVCYTW